MIRATLMACLLLGTSRGTGCYTTENKDYRYRAMVSQGRPAGRPLLGGRHYLLEFPSYPGPEVRQELARHGIRVLQYVPDNTLMVLARQGFNMEGLGASWAGELEAEDKISPLLATHASNAFLVIFYPDVDMEMARTATQLEGFEVLENPDLLPGQLLAIGPYRPFGGWPRGTKCPISCRHPPTCWRVTL